MDWPLHQEQRQVDERRDVDDLGVDENQVSALVWRQRGRWIGNTAILRTVQSREFQLTVMHMDIAIGDVAQLGVHRDDVRIAPDELAARRRVFSLAMIRFL